jgi:ATPase subunit of ABC transporter with duplicated ATPase domains
MAPTLHLRDVGFSYGERVVLLDVGLTLGPGMRLGVLGPNGTGKSTLLGLLSGRLQPATGSVSRLPPQATVGELRQEPERRAGETVRAHLARRTGVAVAQAELDAATADLATGVAGADDRYSDALDRWLALGAADFDVRADETVARLGLAPALLDAAMTTLSGGEAARAGLAAVLLARFDALLLDEPTNDLDFAGLHQLETFALAHPGPLVVVSHDRAFLDRVVTHVAEIDEHTHRVTLFAGGWSAYLHEREVARRHAEEEYARFETRRDELTSRAQREREWAHQGVTKEKKNSRDGDKVGRKFRKEQTEQLASRARRTERAIERLDVVDEPRESWELRFTINAAPRAGAVVFRLDDAVVHQGDFTLGPVTVEVRWGELIGVVGPNGAGKTTLLRALLGRAPLAAGSRWCGPSVVVGEIDQARLRFTDEARLVDIVLAETGATIAEVRSLLAKFGLGASKVLRPAGSLSPGERTRAALALLQAKGVNTLVLDEPTNHLDLPAIEQLEAALRAFPGTVLLVTHDRRLLDEVPLRRLLHVDAGQVRDERLDP